MTLPSILEIGFSTILYLILFYILGRGIYQFVKRNSDDKPKNLVPLGFVGLIFGIIAYIQRMRASFDAIEAAGDISPTLVANSISDSYGYPTLGLLCLAAAFLAKYLNQ